VKKRVKWEPSNKKKGEKAQMEGVWRYGQSSEFAINHHIWPATWVTIEAWHMQYVNI